MHLCVHCGGAVVNSGVWGRYHHLNGQMLFSTGFLLPSSKGDPGLAALGMEI